ncbi:unnamed protein product [Ophioblennius macclurei]
MNEIQKPPCHSHASLEKSAPPPPRAPAPPGPPPFCRGAAGPPNSGPWSPPRPSCAPLQDPVVLLRRLCENVGFGEPVYQIQYSHTGRDGFLYFTYDVRMGGVCGTFGGQVTILPGPPSSVVLKEAQREAAQQLLQRLQSFQMTW